MSYVTMIFEMSSLNQLIVFAEQIAVSTGGNKQLIGGGNQQTHIIPCVRNFEYQCTHSVLDLKNLLIEVDAVNHPILIDHKIVNGTTFHFIAFDLRKGITVVFVDSFIGGKPIIVIPVLNHAIDIDSLELLFRKYKIGRLLRLR